MSLLITLGIVAMICLLIYGITTLVSVIDEWIYGEYYNQGSKIRQEYVTCHNRYVDRVSLRCHIAEMRKQLAQSTKKERIILESVIDEKQEILDDLDSKYESECEIIREKYKDFPETKQEWRKQKRK